MRERDVKKQYTDNNKRGRKLVSQVSYNFHRAHTIEERVKSSQRRSSRRGGLRSRVCHEYREMVKEMTIINKVITLG